MESKAMKILIIEDDIDDCNRFVNCIKERKDIELVGITDSDTEGLKYVKLPKQLGSAIIRQQWNFLISVQKADIDIEWKIITK